MLCLYPFWLEVNGKKTLKPCGKCRNCRKLKSHEWATRIEIHQETFPESFFLTLTYDNPKEEIFSLSVRDLQLFIKRLRKAFPGRKISYFACGEYGTKRDRPHYHALIFGLPIKMLDPVKIYDKLYSNVLMHVWPEGFNTIGFVEKKSIRYVTGYILKRHAKESHSRMMNREPEFGLYSKNLGLTAFMQQYEWYRDRFYKGKVKLPRYYVKKIREIEEDTTGTLFNAWYKEAFDLMHKKKYKTFNDALAAIPRRNKQIEIDSITLEKIYKQENAL